MVFDFRLLADRFSGNAREPVSGQGPWHRTLFALLVPENIHVPTGRNTTRGIAAPGSSCHAVCIAPGRFWLDDGFVPFADVRWNHPRIAAALR